MPIGVYSYRDIKRNDFYFVMKPTPLQQQIEHLVTNGRGYTSQITSTTSLHLIYTTPKLPVDFYTNFFAALEQQRLQATLGAMEAQKSSPTLDSLYLKNLDRILRTAEILRKEAGL